MNEDLEEVRRIISEADPKSVVFFGGAGVRQKAASPISVAPKASSMRRTLILLRSL